MTQDFEISSYGTQDQNQGSSSKTKQPAPCQNFKFPKILINGDGPYLQMEFFCKMSCLHFLLKTTEKYNSCLRYLRNITWSPLSRQLGKYIYPGDRNTWPLATNQLIINSFSQGKRFSSVEVGKDRSYIRLAKARWDPFGEKLISNPMVVQLRLGGWLHRNGQSFSPGVGEEAKKASFLKKIKVSSLTWITNPTAITCDWSPKLTSSGAWKLRRKRHWARLHPPPLLSVSRRERPSTSKGGAATPQPGLSRPCIPETLARPPQPVQAPVRARLLHTAVSLPRRARCRYGPPGGTPPGRDPRPRGAGGGEDGAEQGMRPAPSRPRAAAPPHRQASAQHDHVVLFIHGGAGRGQRPREGSEL